MPIALGLGFLGLMALFAGSWFIALILFFLAGSAMDD